MLRIYKSSAGSGKTYTLVKEYIRIALADPNKYKHILAITFTNKAANEMKERIVSTMQALSEQEKTPATLRLLGELAIATKLTEQQVTEKAGVILRNILHDYSGLSVCTIDSFVHRVIRAFAYDLHLPMNFEVEMDSDKLLTATIELLMDRLSEEDDQVTNAIVEFAESNIEEGKSWNLEYSLVRLAKELFNEDAYPHLQRLEEFDLSTGKKVRAELHQYVNSFEQRLFAEGKSGFDLMMNAGLTAQSFFQTTKGIYGFFAKYAAGEFPNDPLGNSYVLKTINEDKWGGGKTSEADLAGIAGIKTSLTQHYTNITDLYNNHGKDYVLAKLLLRNFYSFILLADIQKLMNEYKKDNNLVHISEFQKRIHSIVKEQDAPVIYERIGEWYDSILIDEHQDTSVLQWQNLVPLVENSQFKTGDSLVVGDGKQAIYRFRSGKVEQFAVLPAIYNSENDARLMEREVAINNYGTQVNSLPKNYRSRKEIVDFNNAFYDTLSGFDELKNKKIYEGQAQLQGNDATGGYVRIEFLAEEEEAEITLDEVRCQRVEAIIADAKERSYSLKDISILTRSNKNGSLIASYLIEKGIPVISSESLLINNSPRVTLVLSVLNYFDQPDDHIVRAELVYYIHLLLLKQEFRFEQFNFRSGEGQFETNVSELVGKEFHSYNFLSYPLVDLVHEVISFFGMNDDDPFLQFFMDEVMAFAANNRTNIREFLDWWEEIKHNKSIIYPDTLDAVKIMTIHKSKGLEFKVVIMADADWPQKRAKNNFWVPLDKPWLKDLHTGLLPVTTDVQETEFAELYDEENDSSFLDMLNLLYVATTRAEDMLYILSTQPKREPEKNNTVIALLANFLRQKQMWDGFKPYEFGEANTGKLLDKKKGYDRQVYAKEPVTLASREVRQVVIRKNSKLLWNEEKVEKINWGNLVHEALRRIKYADDAEKVYAKMYADGLVGNEERKRLETAVNAVLSNEKVKSYFTAPYKVINERSFFTAGENRIPDRIVIEGDKAVILDYKTGDEKDKYANQLAEYAAALKKFGFSEVKRFLVYTEQNKVEEV